ncbi:MAG TPA: glycoside hydrolase family 88 protein [Verrucomicrobiae bacterium]|nr:glycoside hydrolase family 88 protein [Verrucomicrobiae bacterium]
MKSPLLFAAIVSLALCRCRGGDFDHWPPHASPQEIGRRVAARFVATPHTNFGRTNAPRSITYPEVCTWYGALTFARVTGDTNLTAQLTRRFEPLFGADARLIPKPNNEDAAVFGAVPLELYLETKEKRYLDLGQSIADAQWEPPRGRQLKPQVQDWVNEGLSWHTRFWIDDMFMITLLQVQAYRATGEEKYLDRAATEMVAYLEKLQQTNGLFYHAPDVPYFWGRGNGWVAAGMSQLLLSLPENDPKRARILESYRRMMAGLLKDQDADGTWRQLIDHPEAWPESSGSGMFTFALITGVKQGWLDEKTYGPAARKGWLGLVGMLDSHAAIRDVCEGTNKRDDLQYYLNRRRLTGDLHGQAPVLWCATALLQ